MHGYQYLQYYTTVLDLALRVGVRGKHTRRGFVLLSNYVSGGVRDLLECCLWEHEMLVWYVN